MNNKLPATFKSLAAGIVWLGGSLAAITAIISELGFLVLRAHHNLLGITEFVPRPVETWSVEGARFVYNSLLYFFGGCLSSGWVLLLVLATVLGVGFLTNVGWITKLRAKTASPLRKVLILGLSVLGVLVAIGVFVQAQAPSYLLVRPSGYDTAIIVRSTEIGIQTLRARYALLMAILLLLYVWLRLLPHLLYTHYEQLETTSTQTDSPALACSGWWRLMIWVFWVFFLIPLLLLPINYGKMVKSNNFFKVRLLRKLEEGTQPIQHTQVQKPSSVASQYEGWLLYEGNGRIVLYKGISAGEPVHIFKYDDFAQIQILEYENIFLAR